MGKHRFLTSTSKSRFNQPDRELRQGGKQQSSLKNFFATPRKRPKLCSQSPASLRSNGSRTQNTPLDSDIDFPSPRHCVILKQTVANSSSVVSNRHSRHRRDTAKPRRQKKTTQMYLDCGQRDFCARVVCQVCGMLYTKGLDEDQTQHQKVCRDYRIGVSWNKPDNQTIVLSRDDFIVLKIGPGDSKNKARLDRVTAIVNEELGFVSTVGNKLRTTYLAIQNKRIVGLMTVEQITGAFLLADDNLERSRRPVKCLVGVHQIWVHANSRKLGVATLLMDAMRDSFIFGMVVPLAQIGFSSPTAAGANFARRYQGRALVYDCK